MKNIHKNEMNDYEDKFFEKRREIKQNKISWLAYHRIYEHAIKFILNTKNKKFILTNKDYNSVSMIAQHFGIIDNIETILSRDISNEKIVLFEYLFINYKSIIENKHIVYLDDNEHHLADVSGFRIEPIFAKWGYSKKQRYNSFREINSFMELI